MPMEHVFIICAFKESPYLEKCIRSLFRQTVTSEIKMVTSTPCSYISDMARKYKIPLLTNTGETGIAGDWNFALSQAKEKVATIVHQDDIYCPEYTEELLKSLSASRQPLIFFSDYGEIRQERYIKNNSLLRIKRYMLLPLRIRIFHRSIWVRRRILSLGSPISCPTVSYVMPHLPKHLFQTGYRGNVDWQAWERISRFKGDFVYNKKILMYHRIHEGSETSAIIADTTRTEEDYKMFRLFWPDFIARRLNRLYQRGQESNILRESADEEP